MTTDEMHSSEQSCRELVAALEKAWNAGDSAAFAAAFASDADFVNPYGMRVRGRSAIAEGTHFIFTTIYKASNVEYRVASVRTLAERVALVHVSARLSVPAGPLAGTHEALWTGVATPLDDGWKFAAFHITVANEPPIPTRGATE